MATFQVCQPTGRTGLVVAWGVVRSLAGFVVAGPSDVDYLGGMGLPPRVRLVIEAFRYVDTHGLLLCGLTQIGSVVLLLSDSLAPHALAVCPWESHRSQRCRYVARLVCAGVAGSGHRDRRGRVSVAVAVHRDAKELLPLHAVLRSRWR
jgi:hypothetical protein